MMNKITQDIETVLKQIPDGAHIMTSGFGLAGQPIELIEALIDFGPRDLTIINNNAASGDRGLTNLLLSGLVKKMICSFPSKPRVRCFIFSSDKLLTSTHCPFSCFIKSLVIGKR